MIPGKQYTVERLLQIAWRHKFRIVVPAVLVAAVSIYVMSRLPDRYTAETSILIVPQRVPESYVRPAVPTARIDERLSQISNQILSRTRLERVIQDFNLYPEARKKDLMQDIVDRMRDDFAVRVLRGDAFKVSFTADDPRIAMRVTERLASYFIDESLKDRETLAEGTNQFLESQLEDARRKLIENEKRLEDYRRRYDGQLPTQFDANMQALRSTELQVVALADSLNRDRDRRLLLERQISDLSTPEPAPLPTPVPPMTENAAPGSAADQLRAAQSMLQAMLLRYRPEHPDVVRQKRTVAELQRRVDAETAMQQVSSEEVGLSPAEKARRNRLQDAKAELENLDRQIAYKLSEEQRLHGVVADYQRRIEATPTRQAEMTELTRDYETLQQTYRNLLGKKQESQIATNLERRQIGEQFKILDAARLPEKPSSPDRPRLYSIAVAASVLVGLLFAAAAEYLDRALRTEEDVRLVINVPVIATIPMIERSSSSRRAVAVAATSGAALVAALAAVRWTLLR